MILSGWFACSNDYARLKGADMPRRNFHELRFMVIRVNDFNCYMIWILVRLDDTHYHFG